MFIQNKIFFFGNRNFFNIYFYKFKIKKIKFPSSVFFCNKCLSLQHKYKIKRNTSPNPIPWGKLNNKHNDNKVRHKTLESTYD